MGQERLDKLLAATGRWSRREAKTLIREGRVLVGGRPALLPEGKADPEEEEILVDGTPLNWERYTYLMLINLINVPVIMFLTPIWSRVVRRFS